MSRDRVNRGGRARSAENPWRHARKLRPRDRGEEKNKTNERGVIRTWPVIKETGTQKFRRPRHVGRFRAQRGTNFLASPITFTRENQDKQPSCRCRGERCALGILFARYSRGGELQAVPEKRRKRKQDECLSAWSPDYVKPAAPSQRKLPQGLSLSWIRNAATTSVGSRVALSPFSFEQGARSSAQDTYLPARNFLGDLGKFSDNRATTSARGLEILLVVEHLQHNHKLRESIVEFKKKKTKKFEKQTEDSWATRKEPATLVSFVEITFD